MRITPASKFSFLMRSRFVVAQVLLIELCLVLLIELCLTKIKIGCLCLTKDSALAQYTQLHSHHTHVSHLVKGDILIL